MRTAHLSWMTSLRPLTAKIVTAAVAITDQRIQFVVNTRAVACLLVVACEGPSGPSSESTQAARPAASISDGAHGGNVHFFWLPPLVSTPAYSGTFDGSLSPVVEICEWAGVGCVVPLLARFTADDGPG